MLYRISKRLTHILVAIAVIGVALLSAGPAFAQEGDGTGRYIVKSGDRLSEIAQLYDISLEKLLTANPKITDPNLIYTGQVIILPVGRGEGVPGPKVQGRYFRFEMERKGHVFTGEERFYLVRGGDTLNKIARAYGLSYEKLLAENPQIDNPNLLFTSELVKIPTGVSETAPSFYMTPVDRSTSK